MTRFILSLSRGGDFDLAGSLGDGKFLLYAKNIAKDDLEHTVTGMIRLAESPGAAADGLTLCCNAGAAVADGAVDFDMIFQEAEAALDDAKLMKGASYVCSCVEGEE